MPSKKQPVRRQGSTTTTRANTAEAHEATGASSASHIGSAPNRAERTQQQRKKKKKEAEANQPALQEEIRGTNTTSENPTEN